MKMDQSIEDQYAAEFDVVVSSTMAHVRSLFHDMSAYVRDNPNMYATIGVCGSNIVAIVRLTWHMYQAYVASPTA